MTALTLVDTGAEFSADRVYRYRLWRRWADGPMLMVIGLNPSTADETQDDPTIRRCIGYAKRWGFAGFRMANLFAYRATDPREMIGALTKVAAENMGVYVTHDERNLERIRADAEQTVKEDGAILAAWGTHGKFKNGSIRLCIRLDGTFHHGWRLPVACLGLTQSGEPKHPLYLRADATPIPFLGDGGRLCRS
jgi:hypothetical protein